ncbi:DNA repair protein RadC [Candidatus Woesearchaeota archaeon]|nr:DNA repair protein RadC [Candidatus Woesearchaeota archaeon]
MRLLEIPEENRPRERLQKLGPSALSDAELLAIMLGNGTNGENAIEVANRFLSKFSLSKLPALSVSEFRKIKGIGEVKATQLKAAFEISKRASSGIHNSFAIKGAKDVYNYASAKLGGTDKEQFMVLLLNSKNRIIKDEIVSVGILNASLIHPREVFKSAIKESANAIIIVHNHPSGDPTPSEEDKVITSVFKEAGRLLNIQVLDHVIVGRNSHYSFAKEGEL